MKTITFWTSVIIAALIIVGGAAIISDSYEKPAESGAMGYIEAKDVPTTVLDFTDEPPMLITPDM
jgi:hypothetical protein